MQELNAFLSLFDVELVQKTRVQMEKAFIPLDGQRLKSYRQTLAANPAHASQFHQWINRRLLIDREADCIDFLHRLRLPVRAMIHRLMESISAALSF